MFVFNMHPSYWASISHDVHVFVMEHWDEWNEEKPEWFTGSLQLRIPRSMIPLTSSSSNSPDSSRRKVATVRRNPVVPLVRSETAKKNDERSLLRRTETTKEN